MYAVSLIEGLRIDTSNLPPAESSSIEMITSCNTVLELIIVAEELHGGGEYAAATIAYITLYEYYEESWAHPWLENATECCLLEFGESHRRYFQLCPLLHRVYYDLCSKLHGIYLDLKMYTAAATMILENTRHDTFNLVLYSDYAAELAEKSQDKNFICSFSKDYLFAMSPYPSVFPHECIPFLRLLIKYSIAGPCTERYIYECLFCYLLVDSHEDAEEFLESLEVKFHEKLNKNNSYRDIYKSYIDNDIDKFRKFARKLKLFDSSNIELYDLTREVYRRIMENMLT